MHGLNALTPDYITTMNNTQKHTHGVNMTNSIFDTIQAARGNRTALLSLASSETLDEVAAHYNVSPQYAGPKTAQRLFDATRIAIKSTGQPGARPITREYDLTNQMDACEALQDWGVQWRSYVAWVMGGEDHDAYITYAHKNPATITRWVTSKIELIRKNA